MKRLICVLLFVIAFVGWAATMVWAAPPDQGQDAELVVEMSWDKAAVYAGTTVAVEVSIRNDGGAAVPDDAQLMFHLEVRAVAGATEAESTTEEVKLGKAAGLSPEDDAIEITQTFDAPAEGNYNLVAVLTGLGDETFEFPEPLAVQSALPPGIARLFAGLAMFAAVMAILAVGTEVAIDSVKPVLGMKQKVSAMEAFDQLRQELPGQLADLGIDAKRRGEVEQLIKEVQVTLEPVQNAAQITDEIREHLMVGDFGAAFKEIADLEQEVKAMGRRVKAKEAEVQGLQDAAAKAKAQAELANLTLGAEQAWENGKMVVHDRVAEVLDELQRRLPLGDETVEGIKQDVGNVINPLDVAHVADLLGQVVTTLQMALGEDRPDLTKDWLTGQVDLFLVESRKGVLDLLDNQVIKTFKDLGFPQDAIDDVRPKLVTAVDSLDEKIRGKANTYADAVKALLIGVEERRNQMQSPWRKIYRRLRNSNRLSLWAVVVWAPVSILGIVVACWSGLSDSLLVRLGVAVGALLLAVLVGGIVNLIIRERPRDIKLGQALRWVEGKLNAMMGRTGQPEHKYGDVDQTIIDTIREAGPTTIAQVLLEREDFHRDEDASRIRVLRAISIVVGTYLAYLFQIDALVLLEQALPGVSQHNVALTEGLTAGIVLTGLAASAGSKFWRDLLGRLQATKQQAESSAVMLRKAKATLVTEE